MQEKEHKIKTDVDAPCSWCGVKTHAITTRCPGRNNPHLDDELGIGEGTPLYDFHNWEETDREAVKEWLRERERRDAELKKGVL